MTPPTEAARYKNHRFPGEIISHGGWLSSRFPLSDRDVQELLFERGIEVTHEAIRQVVYTTAADNSLNPKTRYNVSLTPSFAGALPWYQPSLSTNSVSWRWCASS